MSGIPDGLKQAAALYQRNDLEGARAAGEATLRQYPNHPVLLQLLGVVYGRLGDGAQSIATLRRALALTPSHAQTRLNFARALTDAGLIDEAVQVTDPETVSGAMTADLWRVRGDALKAGGGLPNAIHAYQRAIGLKPDYADAWNNLGNTLRSNGQVGEAINALEHAVALRPNAPLAYLNLARALDADNRTRHAIGVISKGLELAPNDPAIILDFSNALSRLGRARDALEFLERARALSPNDPDIYNAIGHAQAKLRNVEASEQAYRQALTLRPDDVMAYLNLGAMLERSNRLSDVSALLDDAERNGVSADDLTILRAQWLRREGRLEDALALAKQARVSVPSLEITKAKTIGELADRLGDVDTAFEAFSTMNRLAAAEPSAEEFSGADYRASLSRMLDYTTPEWAARWQPIAPVLQPAPPVFLVGFPRSGTTLLDTVLMGHPDTHVLEEEPIIQRLRQEVPGQASVGQLDSAAVARLRALYFETLAPISAPAPGKLIIDKLPMHIASVPLIHRVFPDAKFIFAERHPCDAVLSCFMQNFVMNQAMVNFVDLPQSAALYDLLIGYWMKSSEVLGLEVHTTRYEKMVQDPESEIRPLIAFLGLPWDDAVLDNQATAARRISIPTPSYAQVTEKMYTRAAGRWERYRKYMEPILPILAPWCARLGYSID